MRTHSFEAQLKADVEELAIPEKLKRREVHMAVIKQAEYEQKVAKRKA